MTKERREELKMLQGLIKLFLAHDDLGMMKMMTDQEKEKWKEEFGDYDFVIGPFAIVNLDKP